MTRNVDYKVQPSMLLPHKVIFAGTLRSAGKKLAEKGISQWNTRADVTEQVRAAFLFHMAAIAKHEFPDANGFQQTFEGVDGYSIRVQVDKRGFKDASAEKGIQEDER